MCKEERSQAFYLPVDSLKIVFKNSKNQKNKQTKQKKKKIKQVFSSAYFHIFLHTQKKYIQKNGSSFSLSFIQVELTQSPCPSSFINLYVSFLKHR